MRNMKHRLVVAGVAALLAGLILTALAFADATFSDLTGDATGGAPDITQVDVSNDSTGLITFRVTTVAPIIERSLVGAFGHSGWGGSCAFADPSCGVSGAYVMNKQGADLIGDPRPVRLINAAYSAL